MGSSVLYVLQIIDIMIVSIIFCLEFYHFLTHITVLFGWRMLPRKDLVKQRIYFLFDLVCAASSYLIHQKFFALIVLQNIQHAYYFFTWEKSGPSKRVVSWSSLDWDRGRWNQIDLVIGTSFDVFIHAMNSVLLIQYFSSTEALLLTLAIDFVFLAVVLYNPKLAWSNPTQIPAWVKKRLSPLSE